MNRIHLRIPILVLLVLAFAFFRAFNHAAGPIQILPFLSPMGAIALFAGVMLRPAWQGYTLTLAALFVSDVVMNQLYYAEYTDGLLYKGWQITYALFALQVAIGHALRSRKTISALSLGAVGAGLVFWTLSNFAMWAGGGINVTTGQPFAQTWTGLAACYGLALPFLSYTLAGNLLYGALLFGGYALLGRAFRFQTVVA